LVCQGETFFVVNVIYEYFETVLTESFLAEKLKNIFNCRTQRLSKIVDNRVRQIPFNLDVEISVLGADSVHYEGETGTLEQV